MGYIQVFIIVSVLVITTQAVVEKKRTQSCSSDNVCESGTTCTSGTCKCSSGTEYNTKLKACAPTDSNVVKDTCSVDSDCYNPGAPSGIECVAQSGSSTKTCECKSAYIQKNYQCRLPHVGEACTAADGCASMVGTIDTSHVQETCQSLSCSCPSSSTKVTAKRSGVSYPLCYCKYETIYSILLLIDGQNNSIVSKITGVIQAISIPKYFNDPVTTSEATYSGDLKKNGETCSSSNQCMSLFCSTCPGTSSKTCLAFKSSATKNSAIGILSLVSIAIMFL
ncbi:hypothetical protein ACF0H5_020234 [Mactra antiquata]